MWPNVLGRLSRLTIDEAGSRYVVVTTHLLDAASGRADDAVTALEDVNEELLRPPRIELVATVGHRLTAASLIQRIVHVEPELL